MSGIVNNHRYRKLLPYVVLVALGIACYANSFQNEFVWDDNSQILEDRMLRSWSFAPQFFTSDISDAYSLARGPVRFYRPLWMLSQLIDYQIWGPHPWGFHLTNTALHIGNGLLVFAMMAMLGIQTEWALLAAGIFLCHPAHLETTTFIAGRTGEMSVLFMLVSLLFFIRFVTSEEEPHGKWWLVFGTSLLAFAFALLSKEIAVTLPADMLALCLLIQPRSGPRGRQWLWVFGMLALVTVAYLIVRARVLANASYPAQYPLPERCSLALRALAAQISVTIAPVNLHIDRTLVVEGWRGAVFSLYGLTALAALIGLGCWFYPRERRVVIGLAFFGIGYLLTSNLIPLNTTFGERWLYWPMVGLLIAIAAGLSYVTRSSPRAARAVQALGWCGVVLFSGLTIAQNRIWRNEATLFETAIARGGDTVRVRENLGNYFLGIGDYRRAKQQFEIILDRHPGYEPALRGIGTLLAVRKEYSAARGWLQQALQKDPGDCLASIWLASIQEQMAVLQEAEQTLRDGALHCRSAIVRVKLADFLQRHDRLDEAERVLRDVLQTDPLNAAAHNSLGTVLFKKGDVAGAEEQFHLALRYDRWMVDAHANLAAVAGARSDWAGALGQYQDALALSPSNADLYYAMGVMLTRSGDATAGSRALRRAVELDPELDQAARQFLNKPK